MRSAMVFVLSLVVALATSATVRADPSALWNIVSGQCVPNQQAHDDPAPCAMVDLAAGSAVLKDLVGETQFLLIPTERSSGIDDPAILAPTAPNYFAAAWRAKSFVDERAGVELPRQWMSLAINSAYARSQNQLHIHVDCVRPDVHDALTRYGSSVGPGGRRSPSSSPGIGTTPCRSPARIWGRPIRSTCWPMGWQVRARTWLLAHWSWSALKTQAGKRVS